jgi:hypothetical protein
LSGRSSRASISKIRTGKGFLMRTSGLFMTYQTSEIQYSVLFTVVVGSTCEWSRIDRGRPSTPLKNADLSLIYPPFLMLIFRARCLWGREVHRL